MTRANRFSSRNLERCHERLLLAKFPPGILTSPVEVVGVSTNVTLTDGATGTTTLSYQWRLMDQSRRKRRPIFISHQRATKQRREIKPSWSRTIWNGGTSAVATLDRRCSQPQPTLATVADQIVQMRAPPTPPPRAERSQPTASDADCRPRRSRQPGRSAANAAVAFRERCV